MIIDVLAILKGLAVVNSGWQPKNQIQEMLLGFLGDKELLDQLSKVDWIKALVSSDASRLNKLLEDGGFDPAFGNIPHGELGLAAVNKVNANWLSCGFRETVEVVEDGVTKEYPALH